MATTNPSAAIIVGQQFPTFADFKHQILRWSVEGKFRTRYQKSNIHINVVVCAEAACMFKVRAHRKKASESVEVTIVNPNHTTCVGSTAKKRKREARNCQAWLLEAVPKVMKVGQATKPNDVVREIARHYGQNINYRAGHRALESLRHKDINRENCGSKSEKERGQEDKEKEDEEDDE